jgi:hypothetical protein
MILALTPIAFSPTYLFITFFKITFLVTVFGMLHGLVFLPIVLALFDCSDYCNDMNCCSLEKPQFDTRKLHGRLGPGASESLRQRILQADSGGNFKKNNESTEKLFMTSKTAEKIKLESMRQGLGREEVPRQPDTRSIRHKLAEFGVKIRSAQLPSRPKLSPFLEPRNHPPSPRPSEDGSESGSTRTPVSVKRANWGVGKYDDPDAREQARYLSRLERLDKEGVLRGPDEQVKKVPFSFGGNRRW